MDFPHSKIGHSNRTTVKRELSTGGQTTQMAEELHLITIPRALKGESTNVKLPLSQFTLMCLSRAGSRWQKRRWKWRPRWLQLRASHFGNCDPDRERHQSKEIREQFSDLGSRVICGIGSRNRRDLPHRYKCNFFRAEMDKRTREAGKERGALRPNSFFVFSITYLLLILPSYRL